MHSTEQPKTMTEPELNTNDKVYTPYQKDGKTQLPNIRVNDPDGKLLQGMVEKNENIYHTDTLRKIMSDNDPLLDRNNPLSQKADEQLKQIQNSTLQWPFMKYYRISATNLESLKDKDNDNSLYKLNKLEDNNLKKIIKNSYDDINENTNVVVPKDDASFKKGLLNTQTFKKFIEKNASDIEAGKYKDKVTDLVYNPYTPTGLVLGKCKLYDLHYDKDGNLCGTFVDKYDFSHIDSRGPVAKKNNNAYEQQEKGYLTNYVLVVPFTIPKK